MSKQAKLLFILLLVMALTVSLFAGCASRQEATPAEFAGVIKLGSIFALSGPMSPMGVLFRESVQIAVDEINASGGVTLNGEKYMLRAYFRDDESQPDISARRLRELNAEGVDLFVGGTAAHLVAAQNEAAKITGSLVIATTQWTEEYYQAGKHKYSYNIWGSTNHIGKAGGYHLAETVKPKKVVFLAADYAFGQSATKAAIDVFEQIAPEIEYEIIWMPVGSPDFTPYWIAARDANPDVIVNNTWGADGINSMKQGLELGIQGNIPIYFGIMISVFATAIEPDAMEGVQYGAVWQHDLSGLAAATGDPEDKSIEEMTADATAKWQMLTGKNPDGYGIGPYMGVFEIKRGIELANSTDPTAVGEALFANPDFMSVKGPATWREDGRPIYKYYFFIMEGIPSAGRKDKVWDFGKVVDVVPGQKGVPTLAELGY